MLLHPTLAVSTGMAVGSFFAIVWLLPLLIFAGLISGLRRGSERGSKHAALAMAYKLLDAAQERWRRLNGHELVADVLADVKFRDGIRVTDDDNHDNEMTEEKVAV